HEICEDIGSLLFIFLASSLIQRPQKNHSSMDLGPRKILRKSSSVSGYSLATDVIKVDLTVVVMKTLLTVP
ncbi:hypothetical protein STEG23_021862, partial [Scotinomys teguina]